MSRRPPPLALRLRFLAAFAAAAIVVLPARAGAQTPTQVPDTQDLQLWAQVVATVSLSENWRLHLEGQPRWADNMSEMDQVILRSAVGRRLTKRITLWAGHAYVPRTRGLGTQHENRAWEQLSATFPDVERWTPSLRVRLEQRFLDGWSDSSHRLRLMGRVVRPLDADKVWSLAAWNEVMFTLDDTDSGGPARGVDQNRVFGGIIRKLSDKAALETGYLWQTTDPPGDAPRRHAHVAFVWLNLTL